LMMTSASDCGPSHAKTMNAGDGPAEAAMTEDIAEAIRTRDTERIREELRGRAAPRAAVRAAVSSAAGGGAEVILLLHEHGADPNDCGGCRTTPLHVAMMNSNVGERHELVAALLQCGADPNARDDIGRTALLLAVDDETAEEEVDRCPLERAQNLDIVRRLLAAGAEPGAQDNLGNAALHLLAGAGVATKTTLSIAQMLLAKGGAGVVRSRDERGRTPLHVASYHLPPASSEHRLELMRMLLEAGADPNEVDAEGNTPLMNVCFNESLPFDENAEAVDLLLRHRARADARNNTGQTAVFGAVCGHLSVLSRLCSLHPRAASVRDKLGRNPLHAACMFAADGLDADGEVVMDAVFRLLVLHGALVYGVDDFGKKPADYLRDRRVASLLRNAARADRSRGTSARHPTPHPAAATHERSTL
jgi:ankyrin repeat protein